MKLQQIRYLLSVADLGSISKAAKESYVSQSSISNAIMNIEFEYGITIFRRTSKGVVLTREGEELLVDLERILYQTQLVEEKYSRKNIKSQRFCVSSQHHINSLDAFLKLFNIIKDLDYRLGFLECKTQEVLENVEKGISDIGVIYYTERSKSAMEQELKTKNLSFNHITFQKPHIYVRKGHPLCEKTSVYIKQIEKYPFITYDQAINSTTIFTESNSNHHNMRKIIYANDRAAVYSIIKSTDAYLVGSGYNLNDDILTIPIQDESNVDIGWITKSNFKISGIFQQYTYFLKMLF
ncbi:LysR family transcriptional regulator [Sporosalibacterium faouarense]|uniref:LysR family transcriptional regulator n=1 Tax=Sporosalibacterium faouarense TaxID=516123 RepID=UPI00141D5032|nr:LysR family transcriptional regulator [Sporosalibacterium faouarense]MTI48927.1 LysR family transcriptional regulator [Bacillota bacterium]